MKLEESGKMVEIVQELLRYPYQVQVQRMSVELLGDCSHWLHYSNNAQLIGQATNFILSQLPNAELSSVAGKYLSHVT
jgi:hypothetical protein